MSVFQFDTMRVMAERLTEDRDFMRVDFLVSDGRVFVGELTSYHESGLTRFEPDKQDFVLGHVAPQTTILTSTLDYHHMRLAHLAFGSFADVTASERYRPWLLSDMPFVGLSRP